VTEDVLLAALQTNNDLYGRSGKPTQLGDLVCYEGFASTTSVVNGQRLDGRILFGFDASTQTWRPSNIGSAGYCAPYVPAEIANHLPGCAS
jgi:hypothetical protein